LSLSTDALAAKVTVASLAKKMIRADLANHAPGRSIRHAAPDFSVKLFLAGR